MATTTKSAPRKCGCGCGEQVTGKSTYRPGHDARHCSQLRQQYEAGKITRDKALAQVAHSERLAAKLARSLELADQRNAARKAVAKEAAAKPAVDPKIRAAVGKKQAEIGTTQTSGMVA